MLKKAKDEFGVYSVFSSDLQDYPYFPFVAKTHGKAIKKFVSFVSDREAICDGAELHYIGTCKVSNEGIIDGSIKPLLFPIRVTSKHNVLGKLFLMSLFYQNLIRKYLEKIFKLKGEKKNVRKSD